MTFFSLEHKQWGPIMNACYEDAGQAARAAMPDWTKIRLDGHGYKHPYATVVGLRAHLFEPCLDIRESMKRQMIRDSRDWFDET